MCAAEQSAKSSVRESSSRGGPHVPFASRTAAPVVDGPVAEAEQVRRQLEALLAELDRREQNLNCQLSLLDRERRAETLRQQRRDAELNEREQEVAGREDELESARAQIDKRQSSVAAQEARLISAQEEWRERRRQAEADWDEQTRRTQSAIEKERAELSADRDAFEVTRCEQTAALERREMDVTQREVDLEKRYEFQQQHLARLRHDLTVQAGELVRERQRAGLWAEQVEATVRLRLQQLRRFRELLDRREADCERGWEELAERRMRDQATLVKLRGQLADDRQMLIDERIALEQQFRRRQEQLDRREAELLSDGLDHRLSEAAASGSSGGESVDRPLSPEIRALDRAFEEFELRKLQWQSEREDAAQILTQREERLRDQEAALARFAQQLAEREAEWARDQQRQRVERQQAEGLIRELLDELGDRLGGMQ